MTQAYRATPGHTQPIPDLSLQSEQASLPVFVRLPPPGQRCRLSGLSRSSLNDLVLACKANGFRPLVASYVLKKPRARTGIRLIEVQSLLAFIRQNAAVVANPLSQPSSEPSAPHGPI